MTLYVEYVDENKFRVHDAYRLPGANVCDVVVETINDLGDTVELVLSGGSKGLRARVYDGRMFSTIVGSDPGVMLYHAVDQLMFFKMMPYIDYIDVEFVTGIVRWVGRSEPWWIRLLNRWGSKHGKF